MVGFLLNRLLHAVAVLFGVVSVTFILLHLAGDPLAGLIPPGASPEVENQIRTSYGLDRPLPEQYLDFMGRAMRGDFGDSWRQGRPALGAVLERLPATLALTAGASALAVAIGCCAGGYGGGPARIALGHRGSVDRAPRPSGSRILAGHDADPALCRRSAVAAIVRAAKDPAG